MLFCFRHAGVENNDSLHLVIRPPDVPAAEAAGRKFSEMTSHPIYLCCGLERLL